MREEMANEEFALALRFKQQAQSEDVEEGPGEGMYK
jgi:hypothetical protein